MCFTRMKLVFSLNLFDLFSTAFVGLHQISNLQKVGSKIVKTILGKIIKKWCVNILRKVTRNPACVSQQEHLDLFL